MVCLILSYMPLYSTLTGHSNWFTSAHFRILPTWFYCFAFTMVSILKTFTIELGWMGGGFNLKFYSFCQKNRFSENLPPPKKLGSGWPSRESHPLQTGAGSNLLNLSPHPLMYRRDINFLWIC